MRIFVLGLFFLFQMSVFSQEEKSATQNTMHEKEKKIKELTAELEKIKGELEVEKEKQYKETKAELDRLKKELESEKAGEAKDDLRTQDDKVKDKVEKPVVPVRSTSALSKDFFFDYDFLIEYNRALKLGCGPNFYFGYGYKGYQSTSEGVCLVVQPYVSMGGIKGGVGLGYKTRGTIVTSFCVKGVYLRTWNDPYQLINDANYYGIEADVGFIRHLNLSLGYFTTKDNDDISSSNKNKHEFTFGVGVKF